MPPEKTWPYYHAGLTIANIVDHMEFAEESLNSQRASKGSAPKEVTTLLGRFLDGESKQNPGVAE